jgi:hypothetical protein
MGKPLKRDFESESFEFASKTIRRGSATGRLAARCERPWDLKSSRS